MKNRKSDRFDDEQTKAILARAIELDTRVPSTTADDLRAIASDIGISAESLEAAMREQATTAQPRRMASNPSAANRIIALGLPIGAGIGAALSTTPLIGLAAFGLTAVGLACSGGLVIALGSSAKLRSFHLRNLAMWGSIAAGSFATISLLGGDTRMSVLLTLSWCIRGWLSSGILGTAAVIAVRRARGTSDADVDDGANSESHARGEGVLKRVARSALRWLKRPIWREAHLLPRVARELPSQPATSG